MLTICLPWSELEIKLLFFSMYVFLVGLPCAYILVELAQANYTEDQDNFDNLEKVIKAVYTDIKDVKRLPKRHIAETKMQEHHQHNMKKM